MTTEDLLQDLKKKGELDERHLLASIRLLHLLASGKSSEEVMSTLLPFFQELSGCEAVAVRLREEEDYPYFHTLGFASEFVNAESHLCAKDLAGQIKRDNIGNPVLECMCGNILCGRFDHGKPFFTPNGSFWTNSTSELLEGTTEEDLQSRTRNRCSAEGYESVALVPLHHNEEIIGLIQFNDRRKDRFSKGFISLVELLADSVTVAVVRRWEEDSLRKREEYYRAMVTAFDGLIYICSADYRIEFLNEALKRRIGHDATGEPCYEALHGLDAICPWCKNDLIFAGESHRWVVQSPKDNRWYEVSNTPIRKNNKIVSKQAMIMDVTERQQLHEEILRKQQDLILANDLLESRVAERTANLEAAMREHESFSYSVSHDLRAPLRHINSFSAIMMEELADELPPTSKDYLERIRSASNRMGGLIDHLLELSRVGRAALKLEPVDLSEMAASILTVLQEMEPKRTVKIFVEEDMRVLGDRTLLQQLLQNLLGNAWKYTSKTVNAHIEFGSSKRGEGAVFYVKDNGAGFDMQYKDNLFVAFQRLHTGEFEGEGIGLTTAQRIIQRHSGDIWAEGEVGKGATFYFTLPN
ncbi:Multi-sensor signal transduction histidine kinase [Citrifermentans bremense]|uniref:histidine kinase n=2 Tax=Citrifermentans bremense TaxID=60035 RepID=A0A7R7FRT0_9BACT|nr:ATP-binding protein [Citrifermentans bremense]BCO11150.1 Multi-sensor signal transduction histidine kinase [Citrifermentans bremense]